MGEEFTKTNLDSNAEGILNDCIKICEMLVKKQKDVVVEIGKLYIRINIDWCELYYRFVDFEEVDIFCDDDQRKKTSDRLYFRFENGNSKRNRVDLCCGDGINQVSILLRCGRYLIQGEDWKKYEGPAAIANLILHIANNNGVCLDDITYKLEDSNREESDNCYRLLRNGLVIDNKDIKNVDSIIKNLGFSNQNRQIILKIRYEQ